jgi:VanZ family protein
MPNSKKITPKEYFLAYLTPTLWAFFIFVLSAQQVLPGFSISAYDFIFKKAAHMFVYAILYLLLFRAYAQTSHHQLNHKSYIIPLSIALLYAIVDEFHQSTVPGRYPTMRDVGYDLLGMATVLLYQLKII